MQYEIARSFKAKNIRLTVHKDLRVVLTVPKYTPLSIARKFLVKKTQWILNKLKYFETNKDSLQSKPSKKEFLQNKTLALERISKKISEINKIYQFKFRKISVKNQSTRWGSCSKKGNLNFNFKALYLPEDLLEYLVTHELCHLEEFNHSKKFWELVAKVVPNHKILRKKLLRWSKNEILI